MNAPPVLSLNPEPFSAAQAVAAGVDFAELAVSAAGLFWNEYRPEDAACRIWRWHEGKVQCLTPDGFSVRSRVYEYGGGSFLLERRRRGVRQRGRPAALSPTLRRRSTGTAHHSGHRYGDVRFAHGQVLAVEEDHDSHRLIALELANGKRRVLAEGADFYAAPILSPDGKRLAWIEWQRPHQPWTSTQLMCASLQADGGWGDAVCVAGRAHQESLQQPCFDAQGRLYCLSDRGGFWQPWGETADGFRALPAAPSDHAPAPWQLGGSSWLPLSDDSYLASWSEEGFGRLGIRHADGSLDDFTGNYSRFRSLAVDEHFVYCIGLSAISSAAVLAIDRHTHQVQVLAGGGTPIPAERITRPQVLRYPSGSGEGHGFFYPAITGEQRPPLVVFVHGGPTSACYPVLDPRIQYWSQRGFAVADLNYRGSTGYGREYRQSLHLNWGDVDVQDACAVVAYLAERGLIDR